MKYPNSIPLWHASGELFPGNALSQVVLSSAGTEWNDVVLEQHDFLSLELADVMYKQHVFILMLATPLLANSRKRDGFGGFSRKETRFPSSRAASLFFCG
jgi:hypothetical protein